MSTGIICEYNPFHNGHAYHIRKIKEMYPDDTIILVMSSNFLQRGETSLINRNYYTKSQVDGRIQQKVDNSMTNLFNNKLL